MFAMKAIPRLAAPFGATGLTATLLGAALALAPTRLTAQEIRGAVRDSAAGAPITAAVISVVDSAGRVLARNLSDDQGRYRIARAPSAAHLQVLRIGFRPRTLDLPAPVAGTTHVDVTMANIPHLLEAVEVRGRTECPDRADGPAALALWEQVRAGLLATVVARQTNPPFVHTASFDRTLDARGEHPIEQRVRLDSGYSNRPWTSARSAADFVQKGFLERGANDRVFYGPDADVLLDDAFSRGYCFQIADADRAHAGQLGLAFAPVRSAPDRVDVTGTLWVDSVGPSLATLDFRYLGLSRAENDLHAGGHIEFRTMPNGVPMTDRWWLRLVGVRTDILGAGASRGQLLQVHEIGGEVLSARWRDGSSWNGHDGTVRGRVTGLRGGVGGATVRLLDSDYRGTTDSTGAFEIARVLPGAYAVAVDDGELAALGADLTRHQRVTVVRDSVARVTMQYPSLDALLGDRCPDVPGAGLSTLLAGRVRNADGSSVGRVLITLWSAPTASAPTASAPTASAPTASAPTASAPGHPATPQQSGVNGADRLIEHGATRDDGTFSVCDVPIGARLILEFQRGDAVTSSVVVTEPADQRVWTVDVVLR